MLGAQARPQQRRQLIDGQDHAIEAVRSVAKEADAHKDKGTVKDSLGLIFREPFPRVGRDAQAGGLEMPLKLAKVANPQRGKSVLRDNVGASGRGERGKVCVRIHWVGRVGRICGSHASIRSMASMLTTARTMRDTDAL